MQKDNLILIIVLYIIIFVSTGVSFMEKERAGQFPEEYYFEHYALYLDGEPVENVFPSQYPYHIDHENRSIYMSGR